MYPYKTKTQGNLIHTREKKTIEAEIGVMQLQIKGLWQSLETGRGKKQVFPGAIGGSAALLIP